MAASIDTQQRAAEVRLYAHYGLTSTEQFVDVGGTAIRVVSVPGDPSLTPVLLLHGAASVTAAAIPLIPALNGAPVYALDWPGHGLSGEYKFGPSTDLRAFAVSVIDTVADHLRLERFDVIAHSLGGQFTLYYCLTRQERVRRLVLVGAPGAAFGTLTEGGGFQVLALPIIGPLILRLPVSLAQYGRNSARTLGPGAVEPWPSELVEVGWYASRRKVFHRTLPGLFTAIVGRGGVREGVGVTVSEAASLRIPVLFVWGDTDVFLSPTAAAAWTSAIPDAAVVELHAGHAPWLNKPAESAAAVSAFLA